MRENEGGRERGRGKRQRHGNAVGAVFAYSASFLISLCKVVDLYDRYIYIGWCEAEIELVMLLITRFPLLPTLSAIFCSL